MKGRALQAAHGSDLLHVLVEVLRASLAAEVDLRASQSEAPVRFRALQRALGKMSQKELTRHLRELERFGLIARTTYPEVPPRVEYALTALGRSFMPALQGLAVWGEEHGRELDANAVKV